MARQDQAQTVINTESPRELSSRWARLPRRTPIGAAILGVAAAAVVGFAALVFRDTPSTSQLTTAYAPPAASSAASPEPTAAVDTGSTRPEPNATSASPGPSGSADSRSNRIIPTPAPPSPNPAARGPISAVNLYYSSGSTASASIGLRYRVLRRGSHAGSTPDGVELDVDPRATEFHTGDKVRLSFESNTDAYLYVVQQGTSGLWTTLFPDRSINDGQNRIQKGKEYKIPSDNWFEFDDRPGTERLFVLLTAVPLERIPGFDRPVTQTTTLALADVNRMRSLAPARDLVLARRDAEAGDNADLTGNFVVNRDQLGSAVTSTFELINKGAN